VGGHVCVTICKKSPAKVTMMITVARRQQAAALCQVVLAVASFATLFGGVGDSCSLKKKVAKWYKRLEDLKAETKETARRH
jgi:hypothetical protein